MITLINNLFRGTGKVSVNRSKHARGIKRSDYANENSILSLLIYEIFLRCARQRIGEGGRRGRTRRYTRDAEDEGWTP